MVLFTAVVFKPWPVTVFYANAQMYKYREWNRCLVFRL